MTQPRDMAAREPAQSGDAARVQHGVVVEMDEGSAIHEHDLLLPWVLLGQAQTQAEGAEAGKFFRRDTGELMDELVVVPLATKPTRTKFPPGPFSRDRAPECWSFDGLTAETRPRNDGSMAINAGRACAECSERWSPRVGGSPPDGACVPGYVMLLLDLVRETPIIMGVSGSQAKLGRIMGARGVPGKKVITVKPVHTSDARGAWWVARAVAFRNATPEETEMARGSYQENVTAMAGAMAREGEAEAEGAAVPYAPGKVFLRGTVQNGPEMRYTGSGVAVSRLTVSDAEGVPRIAMGWAQEAEDLNDQVKEGDLVELAGEWKERWLPEKRGVEETEQYLRVSSFHVITRAHVETRAPVPEASEGAPVTPVPEARDEAGLDDLYGEKKLGERPTPGAGSDAKQERPAAEHAAKSADDDGLPF